MGSPVDEFTSLPPSRGGPTKSRKQMVCEMSHHWWSSYLFKSCAFVVVYHTHVAAVMCQLKGDIELFEAVA
jgi:hypothetical protein